MEEYAANVISDERESQFGGMEQKRAAADREPGQRIARTGLIVRKGAIGGGATGEKPLCKRNFRQPARPLDITDLQRAGQYDLAPDRIISRVSEK